MEPIEWLSPPLPDDHPWVLAGAVYGDETYTVRTFVVNEDGMTACSEDEPAPMKRSDRLWVSITPQDV